MGDAGNKAGGALLAVLCLAQFMLILDVAVVAVAVPSMQEDLGVAPEDAQWATTAYALAFGGVLVVVGKVADLFGARLVFLTGVLGFVAASLDCWPKTPRSCSWRKAHRALRRPWFLRRRSRFCSPASRKGANATAL